MKKKILLWSVIALICCACIGGSTAAWLVGRATVSNTFTVGNISISLIETTGSEYPLVPGTTVAKDPKVTVYGGSEECWLFVKIDNKLGETVTIDGLEKNGWSPVDGHAGYYMYAYAVGAGTVVPVFDSVTCDSNLDGAALLAVDGQNITVTAFAVQSEGVSQEDAWDALGQHFTLN